MEKEDRKNSQICMARELELPVDETDQKEIESTFDEWMERAKKLDRMMSKSEYRLILPSNTFHFR